MRMGTIDAPPCCDDRTARGVAGWLSLAATPAFGAMAVYAGLSGGPNTICSMMPGASPLGGMVSMYVLMSIFHAAPWVTLLSRHLAGARPALLTQKVFG